MTERKRIAVVGSGIAGLTAASILSSKHDVVLFESQSYLGMDAHSVNIPLSLDSSKSSSTARLDVPLRIFVDVSNIFNFSLLFSFVDKQMRSLCFA